MITFALDTNKQKQERSKAYLFNIGILSVPMIYDAMVPSSFIKNGYYLFVGSFVLMNFLNDILAKKIFQVSFDTVNHQITLTSKTLFSKPTQVVIPFGQARLEYIDEGSFLIFQGTCKLCFMKDKMEVTCIKESTSGFSKEAVNKIISQAQAAKIPVTII